MRTHSQAYGPLAAVLAVLALSTLRSAHAQSCKATYELSNPWQTGGNTFYSVNFYITNTGSQAIATPWNLAVYSSSYVAVTQTFNLQLVSVSSGTLTAKATNSWQTLQPNGSPINGGMVIQVKGNAAPESIKVNGITCNNPSSVPLPPSPPPRSSPPPPKISSPPPQGAASPPPSIFPSPPPPTASSEGSRLRAANGKLYGVDGQELYLNGLNWFGFDDGNTMIDGMWEGSTALTQDFATIVYRMQLLGFNAVRLPFTFQIFDVAPKQMQYRCSSVTNAVVAASAVAPGNYPRNGAPGPRKPAPQISGVCNSYLPSSSVVERLLYVVNYFTQNGFYVILDNQLNLDSTAVTDINKWVTRWVSLVQQLVQRYPVAASMTMLDILNEPESKNIGWNYGGPIGGATNMYLRAMDALYKVAPNMLMLIEGTGQNNLGKNWGDGIAVDPTVISQYRIDSADSFFRQVIKKPYVNNVVCAPHVYPPSISKSQSENTGSALWRRFSRSWGYLNKQGYCTGSNAVGSPSGTCTQFAVILGETGTNFDDSRDNQPMLDIASYVTLSNGASDGLHNPVSGYFWWSWNANSGDTHGLVNDDWKTLRWDKIAYLQRLKLKPWYISGSPASIEGDQDPPANPPPVSSIPPPPPAIFATTPPTAPYVYADPALGTTFTNAPAPPPPSNGGSVEDGDGGAVLIPLTTRGSQIIGVDGQTLLVKGVSWHGFDNGTYLQGFLRGNTTADSDFATAVQQIVALGFNTVKLPFSFSNLLTQPADPVAQGCAATSDEDLKAILTPPNTTVYNSSTVPQLASLPSVQGATCNSYLPSTSTLDRFQYVVDFLAANGLYVVLENYFEADRTAVRNPAQWVDSWTTVVQRLSATPATKLRLIVVPISNPDSADLRWDFNEPFPGLSSLYMALMNTLYSVNPGLLYFVEGVGQLPLSGSGGAGFATDPSTIATFNVSDATSFFQQLLLQPYVNQVVVAPRVSPPSVTASAVNATGAALWQRLTSSFGYLNFQGYCANGACKVFPIAIANFGSALSTAEDIAFSTDLASYLTLNGSANDQSHARIPGLIWDGWNNAAVGGIVAADSTALDFNKIDYLTLLGLSPWYTPPTAHKEIPAQPESLPPSVEVTSNCLASAVTRFAGRDPASNSSLGSIIVTIQNKGNSSIQTPYTVSLQSPDYLGISQVQGLSLPEYAADGVVSATAGNFWDLLWPQGTNQVNLGFVVLSASDSFAPEKVYVNGISCDLQPSAPAGEAGSGAGIESVPSDATGGVAALLVTSTQALTSNSIQVASATSVRN